MCSLFFFLFLLLPDPRDRYEQVQEPLHEAAAGAAPVPPAANNANPFAALFAQQQQQQPNAQAPAQAGGPLPNPWGAAGGAGAGAGAGAGTGGVPGLGAAGVGGGNLADLLANPAIQQMTQQMMQNPAMMEGLLRNHPLMGGGGVGAAGVGFVPADLPVILDPATQARYAQVRP